MMKTVKCPGCGKPTVYAIENQFRPFCSERCKLIDLGDWAEGRYAIPVATPPEPEEIDAAIEAALGAAAQSGCQSGSSDDDPLH